MPATDIVHAADPNSQEALDALRHAYRRAQTIGRVGWTDAGGAWWQRHYAALSTPAVGGSLGTLLARGAPMVQRLALLFAVMDGRHERDARHCDAAMAVWDYVEGTWRALYATADALSGARPGARVGDPDR